MLLMLEDDCERLARFAATLRAIDPELPLRTWRDAHAMIREISPPLKSAKLISLDHDLEPEPGAPDPGDGLAVAKFLVSQPVICPVIVHSSNSERSRWMAGEFDLAGWVHRRVPPLGDDWIEPDWRSVVEELLNAPRLSPPSNHTR
jgi:Cyclic-phosphate processing Receiver domain